MTARNGVPSSGPGRRSKPVRSEPERMSDEVRSWAGHWVAIEGEHVIAAEQNPAELAAKLHEMGATSRVVVRFVPEPTDVITIGVG